MNAEGKIILIISYVFPPYPGVGGRRWAKMSKYLTRLGYVVHVITAQNPFPESSTFEDDVKGNKNIHVHVLPAKYPYVLNRKTHNLISKIHYRFTLLMLKLSVKGTIYDKAIHWEKAFKKKTIELVHLYNIKTIVATGAPFRVMYYSVKLKNQNPDLKVIVDMRDPWSWNTHAYGFSALSKKRLEFESFMEKTVVEKADVVLVPVENMKLKLEKLYPQFRSKIHLLPHGYDSDEIQPAKHMAKDKIRLLYYGTLYSTIDVFMKKVANVLARENANTTLDIFSDSQRYHEFFENPISIENVAYHNSVPSKELLSSFKDYDYVLIILPDYGKDNLSTKFFEIIASRIPILYVAHAGKVSSFIAENNVGIWLNPDCLEEDLISVLERKYVFNYNFDFDVSDMSFLKLAESFDELIQEEKGSFQKIKNR